jgi:hypothetical protein
LTGIYAAAGLTHALVSFALRSWTGIEVARLPGLREQILLFAEEVLPEFEAVFRNSRRMMGTAAGSSQQTHICPALDSRADEAVRRFGESIRQSQKP